ncbi:hypothetical protein V8F06_000119 [Rhypophila decipiens]
MEMWCLGMNQTPRPLFYEIYCLIANIFRSSMNKPQRFVDCSRSQLRSPDSVDVLNVRRRRGISQELTPRKGKVNAIQRKEQKKTRFRFVCPEIEPSPALPKSERDSEHTTPTFFFQFYATKYPLNIGNLGSIEEIGKPQRLPRQATPLGSRLAEQTAVLPVGFENKSHAVQPPCLGLKHSTWWFDSFQSNRGGRLARCRALTTKVVAWYATNSYIGYLLSQPWQVARRIPKYKSGKQQLYNVYTA